MENVKDISFDENGNPTITLNDGTTTSYVPVSSQTSTGGLGVTSLSVVVNGTAFEYDNGSFAAQGSSSN